MFDLFHFLTTYGRIFVFPSNEQYKENLGNALPKINEICVRVCDTYGKFMGATIVMKILNLDFVRFFSISTTCTKKVRYFHQFSFEAFSLELHHTTESSFKHKKYLFHQTKTDATGGFI